jgi:hypothetical protein
MTRSRLVGICGRMTPQLAPADSSLVIGVCVCVCVCVGGWVGGWVGGCVGVCGWMCVCVCLGSGGVGWTTGCACVRACPWAGWVGGAREWASVLTIMCERVGLKPKTLQYFF